MEEHMLHDHFMKYNLRFYWKNQNTNNDRFEEYSQAYIRAFSNIPCYQLDRNAFEAELLRLLLADSRFTVCANILDLRVELSLTGGSHAISFRRADEPYHIETSWMVDTTGRGRLLARQFDTHKPVRSSTGPRSCG